jgi:hypothetical protein
VTHRKRTATWKAASAAFVLGLASTTTAVGETFPTGSPEPRIINGLPTQSFATTGALLYSGGSTITTGNASLICSGTLIGCRTFLVAAHCVVDDSVASHYWVYLQHGGIQAVSSVTYNPSYDGNLSGRDVAVVKLTNQVTGIDPTTINTTHNLATIGTGLDGTIAGFGNTGGGHYGMKYYGDVSTADCNTSATSGEGNDKLVCWDYDSSVGPAGTDSNTCDGDSGGPLFMTFSGSTELVGVTSAGISATCMPVDHSWDASVYYNRTWIGGQIGADSTAPCGGLPAVGDPGVAVSSFSGTLSAANPDDGYTFSVGGTPGVVRVTMNADDGRVNPDLFVRFGTGASASLFDCKADGATVFGACEFASPQSGTWSIFVKRVSGSGPYQVTATTFGSAAVCGNNVAEVGEECDGSDPGSCVMGPCTACACPAPVCGNGVIESGEECDGASLGSCALGPCTACGCPAPVCGNDIVEQGEQCDGTDDSACPGSCDGCSCPQTCSTGDLYGLAILSDALRFTYKALLFDPLLEYQDLDPRGSTFTLEISDGSGMVQIAVPQNDAGWIRADPVRRRYLWSGDGTLEGLRRVKLVHRPSDDGGSYWKLLVKGREVTDAGTIDTSQVLDFHLGFDGTCHLETW